MRFLVLVLALSSCGMRDGWDCTFISAYGTCVVAPEGKEISEFEFNLVQAAWFEEWGSGRKMMGSLKVVFLTEPFPCGSGVPKAAGCYTSRGPTAYVYIEPDPGACLFNTSLPHELLHAWYDHRVMDPNPRGDEWVTTGPEPFLRHVEPNFWQPDGLVSRVRRYGDALCGARE